MFKNWSKKDKIISIVRLIVWFIFLAYSFYIFSNWLIIVKDDFVHYNTLAQIFVFVFGLFITFMGIYPICFPKARLMQFFVWLFLILIGYYVFINNPDKGIYIGDMLRVLGAFLVVVAPFWLCVPDVCKKQEEEKNIEIIEV